MIDGWVIITASLAYVSVLFVVAWAGDRYIRLRKGGNGRPITYSLSLAVYCTSWTFFGSVGLAASTGFDFLPVYVGPILMFLLGWPLLVRILRIAKAQNITSIADFMAARYGKSQAVGAIVTIIAVLGTLPYIALQLKAVVISVDVLAGTTSLDEVALGSMPLADTALIVALTLAAFAVLFGTRHVDATEHQEGLMLAIALESIVKLTAFLAVGVFVTFWLLGGFEEIVQRVESSVETLTVFTRSFNGGTWLTITLLSFVCIILLPRQFHVAVVENNSEAEIRRARWLFPLYLVLINIFVVPIAVAGLQLLPPGSVTADMFVLAVPLSHGASLITTIAFIGGISAATAMVIVDSVALAIMVSNNVVMPLLLSRRLSSLEQIEAHEDMAVRLIRVRRVTIFAILLLGYVVYHVLGSTHGLAQIGLLSFAAIAQFAPAFFGGLIWRKATAKGAMAGMLAGFSVWAYTLLLPWIVKAGLLPMSIVADGPLGIGFLKPQTLFFLQFDPLTHGVIWSLAANVIAYITVSLLRSPEPIERLQANIFVHDDLPRVTPGPPSFRLWRTTITVGDLQQTAARYLGPERAQRSFEEFASERGPLVASTEADVATLKFTEHLLASAIGTASSRLVLSLLLRRHHVGSQSALKLLDDASEALQYNRDLLQSALDQVGQGLAVFDRDMRLVCWNRQFRELLDLPAELGRVGMPLDRIVRAALERSGIAASRLDTAIADHIYRLAVDKGTFQQSFASNRVLEVRTSPMPQGGIVATYSDITERVIAAEELARANESLERRVNDRTAQLTAANEALAIAKSKADAAYQEKTRFIAAASHDILQPLNAARLYATSLVERQLAGKEAVLARNIDASLEAVEEILGALIDISRLDSNRMEPELTTFPLAEIFERLGVEFEPMARSKGLDFKIVATSAWVRSDRRLMRRVLQNLVSNAIKYTQAGKVLLGVRRKGSQIVVQVSDNGPGIAPANHPLIFKEFRRLDETAGQERGLGLGLSIVERIGRVLDHPVQVISDVGRGATFTVTMPAAPRLAEATAHLRRPSAATRLSGCITLCIDNEPAVIDSMRGLLQGWGCQVVVADSADKAIAACAEGRTTPHVILADYHLDSGTGIEAIAAIRQALAIAAPAIIITADHSLEVQREVKAAGHHLLRKPLKTAALRSLLMQVTLQRLAAE